MGIMEEGILMKDIVERLRSLVANYALEGSWRAVPAEAADEIERLRAAFKPEVKPLEWVDHTTTNEEGEPDGDRLDLRAVSSIGTYYIERDLFSVGHPINLWGAAFGTRRSESEAAAKAAAQEDFETRIRSALLPVGAVAVERDAIAEEARRYAGFYPEGSDGRNTFIIFAEWIERRDMRESA
jgi:hypothetical protein